jgi:hypothetical protein
LASEVTTITNRSSHMPTPISSDITNSRRCSGAPLEPQELHHHDVDRDERPVRPGVLAEHAVPHHEALVRAALYHAKNASMV